MRVHDRGSRMFGALFQIGCVEALLIGLVAWVFLC